MPSTREYSFITGPETATLPTATAPTSGNDLVTKTYADANYAAAAGGFDASFEETNLSLAASVASSALTISLKTKSGGNPSAIDVVKIGFRSSTAATGTYNQRTVTASLSTVISSGSTAGHSSATDEWLHIYAIDNSGTVELAWSGSDHWDVNTRLSTTAEGGAGAADSRFTLYSTTARSNVPARYLGRMKSNQTTAGTWAAVPTEIQLAPFPVKDLVCGSTLGDRLVWAFITNNGSAAVSRQSGNWISSVTRNNTGDVTINIRSGVFSSTPVAVISSYNSGSRPTAIDDTTAISTTAIRTRVQSGSFTDTDDDIFIIAAGPR